MLDEYIHFSMDDDVDMGVSGKQAFSSLLLNSLKCELFCNGLNGFTHIPKLLSYIFKPLLRT